MKRIEPRIVGGLLLIAGGVLFLLQSLGLFKGGVDLLLGVLLGAGGVFFLYVFGLAPAQKWWAAIPGIILLDLAVLTLLDLVFPNLACAPRLGGLVLSCSDLAGAFFLAGLGLSFWVVYIANRAQWWAVIPGGVLFTLAAVAGLSSNFKGEATGGLFFIGLGATFLLVGLLPTPQGKMRWAFIPAAILLVMGFFLTVSLTPFINYAWALALIVFGGWLLVRSLRRN